MDFINFNNNSNQINHIKSSKMINKTKRGANTPLNEHLNLILIIIIHQCNPTQLDD